MVEVVVGIEGGGGGGGRLGTPMVEVLDCLSIFESVELSKGAGGSTISPF